MSRAEAMTAARQMTGDEADGTEILLPARDQPLIRLALAVQHRWLRASAGMGASVPVALDLVAADVAARWLGITPDARLLTDLTTLEREGLKLMRTEP